MQSFKPDLIVSIHAPYGVLDFNGPSVPPSRLGCLYLDQLGIFPGSLGNYGGVHKGVPVVTIELPNAMHTPLAAEMRLCARPAALDRRAHRREAREAAASALIGHKICRKPK